MRIEDLKEQPPGVLDALPVDVLANLQNQASAHLADATQMVAIIHGILDRRYAAGLNSTGTTHRTDGNWDVTITVPKNVSWDAAKMAAAVETIKSWGEDPANYVDTKISVSETKYNAWPPAVRDLFTPARTVKPGKAKILLSPIAEMKRKAA